MTSPDSKRRSYLSPTIVMLFMIAVLSILFLVDRSDLLSLSPHDSWNLHLSLYVTAIVLGLELTAFIVGFIIKQPRQYGIRWLILLTLAATIPTSMFVYQNGLEKRREEALKQLREVELRILAGKAHRQLRDGEKNALTITNVAKESRLTRINFGIEEDIGCGCCYDDIRTDVSDADLVNLAYFYQLEHLDLTESNITDEGLSHLRKLKHLKSLKLSGNALSDEGIAHLEPLTELVELHLDGNQITDEGLKHLRKMQKLERLRLQQTLVTDVGFSVLGELKNLKEIYCRQTQANGHGIAHLASLPQLTILDQGTLDAEACNMFNSLPSLLGINTSILRPSECRVVEIKGQAKINFFSLVVGQPLDSAALTDLPSLESAHFSLVHCRHKNPREMNVPTKCKICSQEIVAVRLKNLPKLRSLDLTYVEKFEISGSPNIEQMGLRGVDNGATYRLIRQNRKLRHLILSSNPFSDPKALLELGDLPNLESLRIDGPGITDESLAMLEGFPKLKSLYIQEGTFSEKGLRYLASLKNLEEIDIGNVSDTGEPLASLSGLSKLRRIEIRGGDIGELKLVGNTSLEQFRTASNCGTIHLENLPKLAYLRFSNEQTIKRLSVIDLPKLVDLVVYPHKNQLLEYLHLEGLPNLSELRLRSTKPNPHLREECFKHIGSFKNLDELTLDNSRIREKTLELIAQLPKLNRLSLYNIPVNQEAIKKLRSDTVSKTLQVYWRIQKNSGLDANGEFIEALDPELR